MQSAEPVRKITQAEARNHSIEEGTYPAYKIYRSTIVEQGKCYNSGICLMLDAWD
ncbi:hypothetical protein [Anabaenopsis arnoldii]|uniref:Uncharacterized protein n=1 Tax=Anabaenopsis arnoldii TaxID=2152938 RepID=A0ABT5AU40_9CYAN|nr:hypothetical protein [Anabaenopsis arnoldii]MDB9540822.1 hypothetical protein [Anabaenopsis arnoldii]MDH6093260.1 hypothetical protein [Anabaenopsis arnoldii]